MLHTGKQFNIKLHLHVAVEKLSEKPRESYNWGENQINDFIARFSYTA